MVSSNEEDESIVDALKQGANYYVMKPVNMDVLVARIQTQLEIKALSQEFAEKKEVQALNAMITTYNHEINNPLTIAFGMMEKAKRDAEFSEVTHEKVMNALCRVRDIVQKIQKVTNENKVSFEDYVKDTKMIKL